MAFLTVPALTLSFTTSNTTILPLRLAPFLSFRYWGIVLGCMHQLLVVYHEYTHSTEFLPFLGLTKPCCCNSVFQAKNGYSPIDSDNAPGFNFVWNTWKSLSTVLRDPPPSKLEAVRAIYSMPWGQMWAVRAEQWIP